MFKEVTQHLAEQLGERDFRPVQVSARHEGSRLLGLRVPEDLALVGEGHTPSSQAFRFWSIWLEPGTLARHVMKLIDSEPDEREGTTQRITVPTALWER